MSVVFYGGVKFEYTRRLGKVRTTNGHSVWITYDLTYSQGNLKPTRRPDHRGSHQIDNSDSKSEGELIIEVPDTEDENASYLVECKTYLSEEDEDLLDIWHG